jgi:broad specificity phosphatase PhoE
MRVLACILLWTTARADDEMTGAIYVSRHGVRSPYPPGGVGWPQHGQSWEAWTSAPVKRANEFGMTQNAFETQELTAHGKTLVKPLGESAQKAWAAAGLEVDCSRVVTYADDSTRDVQTAKLWLEGLGCVGNEVDVANGSLPEMVPILSDDFVQPNGICKVATEGQARGRFGGDVDALTAAHARGIDEVQAALDMPTNADACQDLPSDVECAIASFPYQYDAMPWHGLFGGPLYYAQYFAESWMFEYLSGLDDFANNKLTPEELVRLYGLHVAIMGFASNYFNSRALGSALLAYVAVSAREIVRGHPENVRALFAHDTNILYLRHLLDLDWIATGWPMHAAPTGGALVFEVRGQAVRTVFRAQSPLSQHSGEGTVDEAVLVIPACGVELCPVEDFVRVVVRVEINR